MESARSTDDIYQTLKNEMISLVIKPGACLSENELCSRFGVSRTPIRAALQRLEDRGFVTIAPYRGTTVTRLNYHLIDQDIYARVAVEAAVLRDFIKAKSPADQEAVRFAMTRLEEEGRRFLENTGDFNVYRFLDIDLAMHNVWFRAINKPMLAANLERMDASYIRFLTLDINVGGNVPDVLADHRALMDIIDSGDQDRVEAALHHHLYGNFRRIGPRIFTEFRDFFLEETLPA